MKVIEDTTKPNPGQRHIISNNMSGLLWSPEPPPVDPNLKFTFSRPFERTGCPTIHVYMPYLGKDASRLLSLRRITALTHHTSGFHGIVFSYDDGTERLYGRRGVVERDGSTTWCIEQSFSVSGGEGEYISGIRTTSRQSSTTTEQVVRRIIVSSSPRGIPIALSLNFPRLWSYTLSTTH